ncbi:MAG: succinate dehydrogenase [Saprospirales bacterium]|nr:MAG: succinate dehydrogenase [Saprospirales bacterium]
MSWVSNFLTSSLGKKLIMSLTGLFLIIFLAVHLAGNLQLLAGDDGEAFNVYAHFMTTNGLITFLSYGLYFFILLHIVQGILISLSNRGARKVKYAVSNRKSNSFASRQMMLLGLLVFFFLAVHMGDFWYKMKFTDELSMVTYSGYDYAVKDLYARVDAAFNEWWIVAIYMLGLLALAFHLWHGFQSAFQTLGLNHKKYTPLIDNLGKIYSVLIPIGFAIIPLYFFFVK